MRLITHRPMKSFFGPDFDFNRAVARRFQPASGDSFPVKMDIAEDDDAFKILAEVPGMNKDDIKIMVKNDILTVSGKRSRKDDNEGRLVWSERYYGSFTRSFKLPDSIDKSGVSADYSNGLLSISLPKREESRPKAIDVKIN